MTEIRQHTVRVREFVGRVGKWETQFPEAARRVRTVTAYHDLVEVVKQAQPLRPELASAENLFAPQAQDFIRMGGAELDLLASDPGNDTAPAASGEGSGSIAEAVSSWLGHQVKVQLQPSAYWLRFTGQSDVYGGANLLVLLSEDGQYAVQTARAQRFLVMRDTWLSFEMLFEVTAAGEYELFFLSPKPFRLDDIRLQRLVTLPKAQNRLPVSLGSSVGKLVLTLNRGREFSTYPLAKRTWNTVFGEHSASQTHALNAVLDYKQAEGYVEQLPGSGLSDVMLHFELECAVDGLAGVEAGEA